MYILWCTCNTSSVSRIEILVGHEIAYSNSWIRGEHFDMTKWKPMEECQYTVSYGDLVNGGYFMLPKMLLLNLKLKLLGKQKPVLEKSYPGSTSIVKHAHRILACTESFLPYEIRITREGVESIGFTDLDGMLRQDVGPKYGTFSAHPIIDPNTGEMYFFSRNGGPDALPHVAYG